MDFTQLNSAGNWTASVIFILGMFSVGKVISVAHG